MVGDILVNNGGEGVFVTGEEIWATCVELSGCWRGGEARVEGVGVEKEH